MTGLRTEELRVLQWSEVDLDAGAVAIYRSVRITGAPSMRTRFLISAEVSSCVWMPVEANESNALMAPCGLMSVEGTRRTRA